MAFTGIEMSPLKNSIKKTSSDQALEQVRRPLISALEPRILFDGAAVADATQALTDVAFQGQSALDGAKNPKSDATSVIGKTSTERSNRAARVEVVFIDAALPDYQTLVTICVW